MISYQFVLWVESISQQSTPVCHRRGKGEANSIAVCMRFSFLNFGKCSSRLDAALWQGVSGASLNFWHLCLSSEYRSVYLTLETFPAPCPPGIADIHSCIAEQRFQLQNSQMGSLCCQPSPHSTSSLATLPTNVLHHWLVSILTCTPFHRSTL